MRRPCLLALVLGCLPALAAGEPAGDPPAAGGAADVVSELRAGVLAHDVDHLWSGFRRESGVDLSGEVIFYRPGLPLPWGRLRANAGFSLNTRKDTSQLYAGLLWQLDCPLGFFFDAGLGAALHDGRLESRSREDQKELGSRVLFRTSLDLGYAFTPRHRLMASFAHISNASLANPNHGLDTVGIRYGFRF